ncbi:MAG TPA: hypothetical protein VNH18_33015, partial [Bryobacteraceae bacterium]|nr:hypothetical protein [Bryobacteraceae bacterium]
RYLDVETSFNPAYGAVKELDRSLVPNATSVTVALEVNLPSALQLYRDALTAPRFAAALPVAARK